MSPPPGRAGRDLAVPGGRRPAHRSARRWLLAAALAVLAGGVAGVLNVTGAAGDIPWDRWAPSRTGSGPATGTRPPAGDSPSLPPGAPGGPGVAPSPASPVTYPSQGPRTWAVAAGRGPMLGTAGPILTFRVAVEKGIAGIDAVQFARSVEGALGDRRSWTGDGTRRMHRVGLGERVDFTVYLTTPGSRDVLCGGGYDRYTSCRNGDSVVINVARWVHGVPHFGLPMGSYRDYVINHEVGHRLGYGHELCPGRGRPAPVMQQQTLGMHGCVGNPWPLHEGRPYHGASGSYDDPVPTHE